MSSQHAKAQEFLVALAGKPPRLPFEPTLLPELFARTRPDSNSSIDSIAALVNKSQELAAQVLRLANSAYYGLASGVASLSHAMMVLGMNEVRNLVLASGAAGALKGLVLPQNFPLRPLWEHQVLTAVLAKELALAAKALPAAPRLPLPDELYAAGLLHDIGKLLLAAHCPNEWQEITTISQEKHLPFFQVEDEYWGIDHSVAGARLLNFWQLPAQLTELVGWHHAPNLADEAYRAGARLLSAANLLACQITDTPEQNEMSPAATALLPEAMDKTAVFTTLRALADSNRGSGLAQALAG